MDSQDLLNIQENIINLSNAIIPFSIVFCSLIVIVRLIQLRKKCFDDKLFYYTLNTISISVISWILIRVIILLTFIMYLYL